MGLWNTFFFKFCTIVLGSGAFGAVYLQKKQQIVEHDFGFFSNPHHGIKLLDENAWLQLQELIEKVNKLSGNMAIMIKSYHENKATLTDKVVENQKKQLEDFIACYRTLYRALHETGIDEDFYEYIKQVIMSFDKESVAQSLDSICADEFEYQRTMKKFENAEKMLQKLVVKSNVEYTPRNVNEVKFFIKTIALMVTDPQERENLLRIDLDLF